MNYQFTKELSLRAILDYNGVLPNASLADLATTKRITGDLLLTYLLKPGTAFYAGYTNIRQNLAILPGSPDYVGAIADPATTAGRQLFFKISYLFRY